MIFVKGGEYDMGTIDNNINVRLSSFKIAKTETTVWQYHLYLRANKLKPYATPSWQWQGDNPMIYVSWYDGIKYANWLSNRLNIKPFYKIDTTDTNKLYTDQIISIAQSKGFRLPTEAEWQYVAIGGIYHEKYYSTYYTLSKKIDSVAWYSNNSNSMTHSVATKKDNTLGVFDLSGNVCEWNFDWYWDYTKSIGKPIENPTGGGFGVYRVYRGGGWGGTAGDCDITRRSYNTPDYRADYLGFRLCLSQ